MGAGGSGGTGRVGRSTGGAGGRSTGGGVIAADFKGLSTTSGALRFDPGTGFVKAKTPKGAKSIEGYQLNRKDLLESRRQAQSDGEDRVLLQVARRNFGEVRRFLRDLREGTA